MNIKENIIRISGDSAILDRPKVALFCSVKCPGKLILDTYDLARCFRGDGVLVISPFHSPMEQECFRILLRSTHPVVWALARGFFRRVPSAPVVCRSAVAEGRLVMVTSFPDTAKRVTTETATARNIMAAMLADAIVVAHAASGSKMQALCQTVLKAGKPLFTFEHPANAHILDSGGLGISHLKIANFASAEKTDNDKSDFTLS
jgi:predicted Rossmann fold nucleotide-binding protein DprA/Smf involved in DNA uptake